MSNLRFSLAKGDIRMNLRPVAQLVPSSLPMRNAGHLAGRASAGRAMRSGITLTAALLILVSALVGLNAHAAVTSYQLTGVFDFPAQVSGTDGNSGNPLYRP